MLLARYYTLHNLVVMDFRIDSRDRDGINGNDERFSLICRVCRCVTWATNNVMFDDVLVAYIIDTCLVAWECLFFEEIPSNLEYQPVAAARL